MRPRFRTLALTATAAVALAAGCVDGRAQSEAGRSAEAADWSEVGYRLGDPAAPIVVVEFSDFGCPYCGRFALATLPGIREEYIDRGLVRWRYVPVRFGFAGGALMGAAAECAGRLGGSDAFWAAHDLLYRRQPALRGADALGRLLPWFEEELGLAGDQVLACLGDPATDARLVENNRLAEHWAINATPTFLINGVPMAGARPVEYFRQVFDAMLDPSGL